MTPIRIPLNRSPPSRESVVCLRPPSCQSSLSIPSGQHEEAETHSLALLSHSEKGSVQWRGWSLQTPSLTVSRQALKEGRRGRKTKEKGKRQQERCFGRGPKGTFDVSPFPSICCDLRSSLTRSQTPCLAVEARRTEQRLSITLEQHQESTSEMLTSSPTAGRSVCSDRHNSREETTLEGRREKNLRTLDPHHSRVRQDLSFPSCCCCCKWKS